jgi:hypothetical protein
MSWLRKFTITLDILSSSVRKIRCTNLSILSDVEAIIFNNSFALLIFKFGFTEYLE